MSLNTEKLAGVMEQLFNDIIIEEKIYSLRNLKQELKEKQQYLSHFKFKYKTIKKGKKFNELIKSLEVIEEQFSQLYDNFDDKLMIFIIGDGNVGKSTLINALIGYQVAETNFLPNTWKIDVYSPELEEDVALIKYSDGKKELLKRSEVESIIKQEETKCKESKATLKNLLNSELKKLKTKEERKEMTQYLTEKNLYTSNITEVRWSVKSNWILDKCLLVDTPGLNQQLFGKTQIGNIHNYYHKADGVLWILDGQTISAVNAKTLFEELNDILQNVGGVRDNIVGVINRMDLVRNNGGQEAVNRVMVDADKIFGKKFHSMIGVSAQQAFEGISQKNNQLLESSGILALQNKIRDIFIAKSESIKNNAKVQGHNRLVGITIQQLNEFTKIIDEYKNIYLTKQDKVNKAQNTFKEQLNRDIEQFFENYLDGVKRRVDTYINNLAEGQGSEYVKQTMYQLDTLNSDRQRLITNKELELTNSIHVWETMCTISEYKYIKTTEENKRDRIKLDINLNLEELNDIAYFSPKLEADLFTLLGNMLGKGMFWLRKGGIKEKINNTIRIECEKMKEEIKRQFEDEISIQSNRSTKILNDNLESILMSFNHLDSVKAEIGQLIIKMQKEKENVTLKDIIS